MLRTLTKAINGAENRTSTKITIIQRDVSKMQRNVTTIKGQLVTKDHLENRLREFKTQMGTHVEDRIEVKQHSVHARVTESDKRIKEL